MPKSTSSIEPIETKPEKPTFSFNDQSRTAVQSAPDWLRKATEPPCADFAAKVAFNPMIGLITPRQFGPITRILPAVIAATSRSSAMPSGPASLKPAEMMMPPGMPQATASRRMPGTVVAGVVITTTSGRSGRSASEG